MKVLDIRYKVGPKVNAASILSKQSLGSGNFGRYMSGSGMGLLAGSSSITIAKWADQCL